MKNVNLNSKNVLAKLMATENLTVEHQNVQTASFDVKGRILTLPTWKEMSNDLYEGLITHEVGHALYTPFEEWMKFVKENPSLKSCANIIEDARIEKLMKIKFPGVKRTMFSMYKDLLNRDFFGTADREFDTYGIIDRINLHFKLGVQAQVPFSDEEIGFVDRITDANTFEEVLTLAIELGGLAKDEQDETDSHDFANMDDEEENNNDTDEQDEDSTEYDSLEQGGQDDDEDEEPTEDEQDELGNINSPSDFPESETQEHFDNKMKDMNNERATKNVYMDIPKIDMDATVVGYKKTEQTLTEFYDNFEHNGNFWMDSDEKKKKKVAIDLSIKQWKKEAQPVVNYLVKEFEMKQAATAHRRTRVSKTGVLDTNKMHAYKFEDDIFKSAASVQDGRNHGLLMYIDWSGSMYDKIFDTIKQCLSLVMFARKVGIPCRVYLFTDDLKSSPTNYILDANKTEWIPRDFNLIEMFNEKMSAREFNNNIDNMMKLGIAHGDGCQSNADYCGFQQTPEGYGLRSTPLNEAIFAAYTQVETFRRETGKEKINTIFLTDGASNGSECYHTAEDDRTRYCRYDETFQIRDPKTKQIIYNGANQGKDMTEQLLEGLQKNHNVNTIGFHITGRKDIRQKIYNSEDTYEACEVKRKFSNKNGYVGITNDGYTTYFLIDDKKLDVKTASLSDVEDGSKSKLRTAFKKLTKGRKVNKMMLNEFVALVA